MLDFIPQFRFKMFEPPKERVKCYVPDFGSLESLYKEFGVNNDIDLAMQKPQYKNIIDQRLSEIPVTPSPGLSDEELMSSMVSKEADINELREYAVNQGNEYRKSKDG